jgi:hypothetical protein
MDCTPQIPWKSQWRPFITKCGLDLAGRHLVLRTTHHLLTVKMWAKYFQIPLMDEKGMHWKQNIHYNKLCQSLTTNCDLNLGGRRLLIANDTLWTFVPNNFKIPWFMKKVWTGHKIYPVTDFVNIWPPSVTLILEEGHRLLCLTYRLIIVNICSKYFQKLFMDKKVMDRHDIYTRIDNVDV